MLTLTAARMHCSAQLIKLQFGRSKIHYFSRRASCVDAEHDKLARATHATQTTAPTLFPQWFGVAQIETVRKKSTRITFLFLFKYIGQINLS